MSLVWIPIATDFCSMTAVMGITLAPFATQMRRKWSCSLSPENPSKYLRSKHTHQVSMLQRARLQHNHLPSKIVLGLVPIMQSMAMQRPSPTLLSAAHVPPGGKWIWEDYFLLSQSIFWIAGAMMRVIPLHVFVVYLMPPLHCSTMQDVVLNRFPSVMYVVTLKSSTTLWGPVSFVIWTGWSGEFCNLKRWNTGASLHTWCNFVMIQALND